MIDEATPAQPDGGAPAEPAAAPAQPAAPEPLTLTERVVTDAEAEIKGLAQQLWNRIAAIEADTSSELMFARQAVDHAVQWVVTHFDKVRDAL